MRNLLIKITRLFREKCQHFLFSSTVPALPEKAPVKEDLTLYRMPFEPTYASVIQSLRAKGWLVTLEINIEGELEYVVQLINERVFNL